MSDARDERTLRADGLYNGRDLGGLRLRNGSTTPTGRVFRSEGVDRLTAAGWDALHDAGIRTVVDLRAPSETARDTGVRPEWLTTVVVDHDGLDVAPSFWEAYWETGLVGTPLYYGPHLAELPERTGEALRAIARAEPGGVLFHCAGGRDRTGIVALALLTIAGVEPEAIVADYLATVGNAPALLASIGVPANEDRIEALCAEHGTTVEDAFRAVVDGLDVDRFVERSGLDTADLEALRTFRAAVA
ncbi:tyrosine-protein phosphatase [Curtobacterium pusillum]|uniref:Tyrosine-protein phosphatase n=1 Tax=Curtobacterium pusillum TaxID=69373 RepID=A0ABX2MH39_9MICO|nr:tyrosine-protein phosphatase [Curtobacterium pusillum]NUU15082.1 tyrosine-protein phosphatase [Curtobacterium pusillum]GLK32646.1 protein-tyrosine-phosphatase [Curtobacterium pusillum]